MKPFDSSVAKTADAREAPAGGRLVSLDALRGFDMFWMAFI